MSTLQHTCNACGHVERAHRVRTYKIRCMCCHQMDTTPQWSTKPVLTPTFDAHTGKPEALHRPGSTYNAGTIHKALLCACEACEQAYEEAK